MNRKTILNAVAIALIAIGGLGQATGAEEKASAPSKQILFNIPAGELITALEKLGERTHLTLVYDRKLVEGKPSVAVNGRMSVEVALKQLLEGTGLGWSFVNDDTVVLKGTPSSMVGPADQMRVAEIATSGPSRALDSPGSVESPENQIAVTGSRIRGAVGDATIQPVFVYTREDLDRFGVQTFAELQRYIPQLPPTDWNLQLETSQRGFPDGSGAQGFMNFGVGLRGIGGTATLVLLDGRRVNKLGQGLDGAAYDLNGIPLSAVERIEVLTDGASAVYGADALAGVVNIILRKEYSGTQAVASHGNTFDTDTGDSRLQLSHGMRAGALALNVSLAWSKTNSLAPRDRWWSASDDKTALGGFDGRGPVPGGTGLVRTVDGSNLPGLASPTAAIPSGSDGINLTIADYANAGPIAAPLDRAKYADYGRRATMNLRTGVSYRFSALAEAYLEGSWNETTTISGFVPSTIGGTSNSANITLPAGYPGNPFGVPIRVWRTMWELLPHSDFEYTVHAPSALAGVRGELPRDWRYDFAVSSRWIKYSSEGLTFLTGGAQGSSYTRIQAAVNNPDPAQRLILLNDAQRTSPNSAGLLRSLLFPREYGEAPDLRVYDFKADGPLWSLPAGPVRLAFGGEYQEDEAKFEQPATASRLGGTLQRSTRGAFVEVQAPLIAAEQGVFLVHSLRVNASARDDRYSDFGHKTVPRIGAFYHPVRWMGVRASYGEGYKVPTLHQLYQTERIIFTGVFGLLDPLRGNQQVPSGNWTVGGNPDLKPEESENINAGVVMDVPGIRGLSLSADYFDLKHTNRITSGDAQAVVNNFPERIVRAAPTPADIAAGYAGVITGLDNRAINIAYMRTSGMDYEVRYDRSWRPGSQLLLRLTASKANVVQVQAAPGAAVDDLAGQQPWRGTAQAVWLEGGWEYGVITTYSSGYADMWETPYDRVALWDFQVACDFARTSWRPAGWIRHLVGDSRLSLNVINAFDREPQIYFGSVLGTVDPRGRRYNLSITRQF